MSSAVVDLEGPPRRTTRCSRPAPPLTAIQRSRVSRRPRRELWRSAHGLQCDGGNMNPDMAEELLRYNTWANRRLFDAVARLDSDQFTRNLGGSFPSIQSTLTHIVWVEWLWVERWQGHSPKEVFL